MDEALVGAWTLVDWTTERDGGVRKRPFGDAPRGSLVYAASGHLTALLARADRGDTPWDAPADGVIAYAARWTREGDRVHHHVSTASVRAWEGTVLTRTVGWDGDRLVLSTDPGARGEVQRLVWARAR